MRHGLSKAGNDHVHIVVSLVHEDGRKADVWNDRPKAQQLAGELERKYGLQVLESRGSGDAVRGQKPAEVEVAVREQLAATVRATAAASASEAQFVERMRATPDVRIRPRFAAKRDDVVTGYSVAWAAPGASSALTWHGGGALGKDLSLPRLREGWPDTPEDASAAVPQWQAAKRGRPLPAGTAATRSRRPAPPASASRSRCAGAPPPPATRPSSCAACAPPACGSGRATPRAAPTASTGYSVALGRGAGADVWYAGGRLARDLTLPRLREDWSSSPDARAAAVGEWRAATTGAPVVTTAGPETTVPDPELWARYTTEVTQLRERLRSVPIEDRATWAHVAREAAGAFAAWSQAAEGTTPGPLAATSEILARSAQLRAHQVRPRPAGLPSARGAALLLASVAAGGQGTIAQTVLLRQLANTVKALHDARAAAGDAQRAAEIRDVVMQRLSAVHDALPDAPEPVGAAGARRRRTGRRSRPDRRARPASRPSTGITRAGLPRRPAGAARRAPRRTATRPQ